MTCLLPYFFFFFFKFKTFLIYILSVTTISSQRGSFTTVAKLIWSLSCSFFWTLPSCSIPIGIIFVAAPRKLDAWSLQVFFLNHIAPSVMRFFICEKRLFFSHLKQGHTCHLAARECVGEPLPCARSWVSVRPPGARGACTQKKGHRAAACLLFLAFSCWCLSGCFVLRHYRSGEWTFSSTGTLKDASQHQHVHWMLELVFCC